MVHAAVKLVIVSKSVASYRDPVLKDTSLRSTAILERCPRIVCEWDPDSKCRVIILIEF